MSRFGYVMTAFFAVLAVGTASAFPPAPRLIWNASASVPIGLYVMRPVGKLHVSELVVVRPPDPLATFLDQRRYLAKGLPMLKRVLALPEQRVCRTGSTITIDGVLMGKALDRDSLGRSLPSWNGCRVLLVGQVFLMNWRSKDSFDGRYFGPLPASTIIGRADPLWTRGEN